MTNKIRNRSCRIAITRNLVEAMGGTIDVESELRTGSCFGSPIELKLQRIEQLLLQHKKTQMSRMYHL